MKKLLNTLFVTTNGAYLHCDGETVRVEIERETRLRVPVHTLDSIVCIGNVMCSPPLMGLCAKRNVHISFLSMNGRFWARVQGPVYGNVLLRREQYRRSDDEFSSAEIARNIVFAKIANCRVVLQRYLRDRGRSDLPSSNEENTSTFEPLRATIFRMRNILRQLQNQPNLDQIRGFEGEAAHGYFGVFDHLITVSKDTFFFKKRTRRPPLDNLNALLSFLYTLLVHDCESALEGVGLDPAVGFLHRDRPGRPGLALDMMEELRPYLADRLALSLINRQQIQGRGFNTCESGAVMMDDQTRKEVIIAWQKRKQESINHPFLGEKIEVGLIPYVQAILMARYLRGDLDGYPPFIWK